MRFVTYTSSAAPSLERVGVLHDDQVHELADVRRILDLLGDDGSTLRAAGDAAIREPASVVALDEVRLRPPIPDPPSMRDFMTFEAHVAGTALLDGPDELPTKVWYRQPIFYFSNPAAMFATGDDVPVPPGSRSFDFEMEVAAVVGRAGADLTVEEALDHVVGYMVLNDWSARDLQGAGDARPARARERQGHRDDNRSVARDCRRARSFRERPVVLTRHGGRAER